MWAGCAWIRCETGRPEAHGEKHDADADDDREHAGHDRVDRFATRRGIPERTENAEAHDDDECQQGDGAGRTTIIVTQEEHGGQGRERQGEGEVERVDRARREGEDGDRLGQRAC